VTPVNVTVRSYTAGDAPRLAAIFHDAVHRVPSPHYDDRQRCAWSPAVPDAEAWHRRMAARTTLVALVYGEAAGFAELDPPDHLDMLYVGADHQGRGIATALLDATIARARGYGARRLVTEASLIARPFFAARGFALVREETVERDGIALPRAVMERTLGDA
jgi:putative acetyltransferase